MKHINKVDVLNNISQEMKKVVEFQEKNSNNAFDTKGLSYVQIRENYIKEREFWNEGGEKMVNILDINTPVENGYILTRVYYPNNRPKNSAIFFIHGGGFTVGSINTHDKIMRIIAKKSESVVIGIDYSLSPEAKFPKPIKECVEVVNFYRKNADKYNISSENIGFAGDSCGAYISLATFLWLRDKQKDVSYVKGLLLYYGLYGLEDSVSRTIYGGYWDGLSKEDIEFYYDMYLEKKEDKNSPYVRIFNNDLISSMVPCFIASCEFDPLKDDSRALHEVFEDKNIKNVYKEYKGTLHAFLHYSKMMKVAYEALDDGCYWFKSLE